MAPGAVNLSLRFVSAVWLFSSASGRDGTRLSERWPVTLWNGEWFFLPRELWLAGTHQPSAFGPTGQPYVSPGQSAAPPWVCGYPTSSKPQRGGPNPTFAMSWGIVGAYVRAAPLGLHAGALPIPRAAPWADLGSPRWDWGICDLAMGLAARPILQRAAKHQPCPNPSQEWD